jgi:LacI family transcriptional regulator
MAMGALLALHELDYDVPGEVAVVGFDGLPASQYTVPPLTTIRQPVYEKGQVAANMLIDEIEGDEGRSAHTELEPELMVRQSCGAL